MAEQTMRVEVAYAIAGKQFLVELTLPLSSTVADAINRSGVLDAFPELDTGNLDVGIFSRAVTLETELTDGDRVEIYRPLLVDPKEARRLRAAAKKKKGK